jgi:cytochrome c oxidase assembly protein subunit 15
VRSFRRFSVAVLFYNLAVILWGAVVRASGSGAGCGSHWPLCNAAAVPQSPSTATLIEYSHRLSSGLVLVLVVVLALWAFRVSRAGHPVRRAALWAVGFTLSEALVGAGLVLFRLVAHDESVGRALAIGTHLLNTLFLLAALMLTFLRARDWGDAEPAAPLRPLAGWCWTAAAAVMVVGVTGAISALGDTLFPAVSLRAGVAQELASTAHLLLRLRVIHPFLALAVGLFLLSLTQRMAVALPTSRRAAVRLRLLVLAQWALGALDVAFLAPVWLQLAHLLVADLVWLALVVLVARVLDPFSAAEERMAAFSATSGGGRPLPVQA